MEGFVFLKRILEGGGVGPEVAEADPDREIRHLLLYLHYFEEEFLVLLSETKLKLDFKHSLERDSYYHRFESLRRLFEDLRDERDVEYALAELRHRRPGVRRAVVKLNDSFSGTVPFRLDIEASENEAFLQRKNLRALEAVHEQLAELPDIGFQHSTLSVLKSINYYFHDSTACLVVDGKIAVAIEEERLTREKHTIAFPQKATERCLSMAGLNPKDIDAVAVSIRPSKDWSRKLRYGLGHPSSAPRFVVADMRHGGLGAECVDQRRRNATHGQQPLAIRHALPDRPGRRRARKGVAVVGRRHDQIRRRFQGGQGTG